MKVFQVAPLLLALFMTTLHADIMDTIRKGARTYSLLVDEEMLPKYLMDYYQYHLKKLGEDANQYPELLFRYYMRQSDVLGQKINSGEYDEFRREIIALGKETCKNLATLLDNEKATSTLQEVVRVRMGCISDLCELVESCQTFAEVDSVTDSVAYFPSMYVKHMDLQQIPTTQTREVLKLKLEKNPEYRKRVFDFLQMLNNNLDIALLLFSRNNEKVFWDEETNELVLEFTVELPIEENGGTETYTMTERI